jgi:heme oxygenase
MPDQAARRARGCPGPAHRDHGLRPGDADRDTDGSGPRRGRLRRATAAPHRGLEARLEAAGCFDDRDGHVRHLRAIAPIYAALEEMLDGAGAGRWLPDWPRRRKAGLIRADLRALGAGEPPASPARAAVAAALPSPWHAGAVFAVLYVLEGATLGGAVLARRVARLGLARGCGASFLDPYGADRGAMWRGYLRALEGAELTPGEEAGLCPWAAATFALFAAWAPAPHPRALPAAGSPP